MGNLRSFHGVRQGDPLSPILFVLAQQFVSSNLKARIQQGNVLPYKMGRNILSIFHLFYANDVLVFSNVSQSSLTSLMDLFHVYQLVSGQLISNPKSHFFLGDRANSRASTVVRLSGMARGMCPIKYLGVPLFIGWLRVLHFEFLMEKIRTIIEGWKARLLSFRGKLTLIKSVLHSIPIYSMASTMVHSSVIKRIERLMANFLWSSKAETQWERNV